MPTADSSRRSAAEAAADRCAACGAAFHCGIGDAEPCWCTALVVDPAKLAAIAAPDAGCLCPACLARAAAHPGGTLPQA